MSNLKDRLKLRMIDAESVPQYRDMLAILKGIVNSNKLLKMTH